MKYKIKKFKRTLRKEKGITLVSLVITIVILIILSTIAIQFVFGDSGLIKRAEEAKLEQSKAEAREKLELVLADAYAEKKLNKEEYNQYEFLDQFVSNKTNNMVELKGDTAIYNGYAFEIDRTVPELNDYVGIQEELKFPEVNVIYQNAEDNLASNVTIKAKEEQNGISKMEILEDDIVIHTFEYENIKSEIIENYELKRNGNYTVKVYSILSNTAYVNIEGLTMSAEFSQNGNTTWKTEHSTTLNVSEEIEKVKSIKYQWTQETVEPEEDTFVDVCNNGDTISEDGLTGKWYLWILIESEDGTKKIDRSEAFYFDNEEPKTSINLGTITTNSIELIVDSSDDDSGLATSETYQYYLGDTLKETTENNRYTFTGLTEGTSYTLKVDVADKAGNTVTKTTTASTEKARYSAGQISKNPTEYYGAEVKGYTCSSSGVSTWRIFYADSSNIYLIADDYISYQYAPDGKNGSEINTKGTIYRVSFDNVCNDYTGAAWINANSKAKKWISKYLAITATSTNDNIKSVAYMLDTNIWSTYAGTNAEYAIGGPTLEMFSASYKQTHSSKYIDIQANSTGYQGKWNTDSGYSTVIRGLPQNDFNQIYIKSDDSKAYGMWLASPSGSYSDRVNVANCSGSVEEYYNDLSSYGLRPLVCLKSSVQLEKQPNGAYLIVK